MADNNVIIISDKKETAKQLVAKILLLRSVDSVGYMNYETAEMLLKTKYPDVLLVHLKNSSDIKFIKKIKSYKTLEQTSFIALFDKQNNDLLCEAFDSGIDDFFDINSDESAVIMRIMWGLKRKLLNDSSKGKSDVLSLLEITDTQTGFYKKNYTKKVFKKKYTNAANKKSKSIFMVLSFDIINKSKITQKSLSEIIYKCIRSSDDAGFAQDDKIYLLLNQSNEYGAKCVYKKINTLLKGEATVSAAGMDVSSCCFEDAERILKKNHTQALKQQNTFIFLDEDFDKVENENFDKSDLKENNFAILKRVFLNRTEKIITPVFFKMQAIYEPKLYDTVINQKFSETESIFSVNGKNCSLNISILYNDYTTIHVIMTENDKGKINMQKASFAPKELTAVKLENIIQKAVEKYQKNLHESDKNL
ncbi:MAG: hypothetical protein ACI37Z_08365 [Candidatus Gastranaerophilaceae bacterium]